MPKDRFYDDTELIVGDVYGLRHFALGQDGKLRGVVYPAPLLPGVNEAVCFSSGLSTVVRQRGIDASDSLSQSKMVAALANSYGAVMYAFSRLNGDLAPRLADWPDHKMPGCTCGFYAYFSANDEEIFNSTVGAVVRATGRTLVGTVGFRTQRIELVALWPTKAEVRRRTRVLARLYPAYAHFKAHRDARLRSQRLDWGSPALGAASAALLALPPVNSLTHLVTGWSSVALIAASLLGFAWVHGYAERRRSLRKMEAATRGGPDFFTFDEFKAQLNAAYPGVPIYRTRAEALAAHPTSQAKDFDY